MKAQTVWRLSFNAGWQTHGSGRNYASQTGHGSMIGMNTGKMVSYSYRCKTCRFCDRANDGPAKQHDCRKSWDKSSKAMESDMAIEMLQDLKVRGFHVKKLVMDNYSTTISRAMLLIKILRSIVISTTPKKNSLTDCLN